MLNIDSLMAQLLLKMAEYLNTFKMGIQLGSLKDMMVLLYLGQDQEKPESVLHVQI